MENKKAKIIIIAIVMLLLLICLGVIIAQYINTNKALKKQEAKPEVVTNQTPVVEEKTFDPYENYSDIKWAGLKISSKITFSIEDGVLYYVSLDKKTKVNSINGVPKCIAMYNSNDTDMYVVITEDGKAWILQYDGEEVDNFVAYTRLEKYNIVDMTTEAGGIYNTPIYFLTSEGKLMNADGISFEDLNQDFVAVYNNNELFIGKDKSVSYIATYNTDTGTIEYKKIKFSNGQEVFANKIVKQNASIESGIDSSRYIFITTDSKLVYFKQNATEVAYEPSTGRKVTNISFISSGKTSNLIINMSGDYKITMLDVISNYYDTNSLDKVKVG